MRGVGGEAPDFCSCIVVLENLLVAVALFAHDGSTDLAESDTVTPASPVKDEAAWDAVSDVFRLDGECAALQG